MTGIPSPELLGLAMDNICLRLGGHTGVIREIFSSSGSDTLVTVSYDKSAKDLLRIYLAQ
eukprot:scaffold277547_cov35-Attheya_sp.AAC.1